MWNPCNPVDRFAKHASGFRGKGSTRCDCPVSTYSPMQYISVDKTTGEKAEM